MFDMGLKRNQKKEKNNQVAKIQGAYLDMPDEDLPRFLQALDANGIAGYNAFFRECVKNFLIQTKSGKLIAWPPEFILQDRSNEELVRERWEYAKEHPKNPDK
jgi:hypothetical protein